MPNTATIPRVLASFSVLLIAGTLLGACEQTAGILPTTSPASDDGGGAVAPGLPQFTDVYVPPGAKLYVERTMIFGDAPWYGQLALGASADPYALFEQYRRDMTGLGWQEMTSIRAPISVITFSRDDRVATVQIQGARLRGSEITITVSPRGGGMGASSPMTGKPSMGGASRAPSSGGGSLRPVPVQRGQ